MLEMRPACEKCDAALADDGDAIICGFECTFCVGCGAEFDLRCPNCSGELVRRRRRTLATD